jgi:separase
MSSEEGNCTEKLSLQGKLQRKSRKHQLVADAYFLCSILAIERGTPHLALIHAKQSVKLLRCCWASIEERRHQETSALSRTQEYAEKLAEDASQLNLSTVVASGIGNQESHNGSDFWALITPLFRGLSHLSELYAHHGMFQETMYYAEQALKLVEKVGSKTQVAVASAHLGSIWLKAGALDKGAEFFMAAKRLSSSSKSHSKDTALLDYHLGSMQGLLGDPKAELAAYNDVEATLENLTRKEFINAADQMADPVEELNNRITQLAISKKKAPTRKATARPKAATNRKTETRFEPPMGIISSVAEECLPLMLLKATVLRQKAQVMMRTKGFSDALGLLQEAEAYSKSQIDAVNHGLAMAKRLLLQSIEHMNADPLYSVLQDSTISFPAVVVHGKTDKSNGEKLSFTRLSPSGKSKTGKNGADQAGPKSLPPQSFVDTLHQAQEYLVAVHSAALAAAPVTMIHSVSVLLNSVAMLLSAADQGKGKSVTHPGFASCLIGILFCSTSSSYTC